MGLTEEPLWELQWHPGGGGRVRRAVLTRRGLRRAIAGLVAIGVLVLGMLGILPIGLRGVFARFTVDAAKKENRALKKDHEEALDSALGMAAVLRHRLLLARRLAWVTAPGEVLPAGPIAATPGTAAGEAEVLAWLEARLPQLDALTDRLSGAPAGLPCPLASLPTAPPVDMRQAVPVAPFGQHTSPFTGKSESHHGVTLAAPRGEPVVAPGAGKVAFAGAVRERRANEWTRFGTIVVVDHGGSVFTVYGHLGEATVKKGQAVTRGTRLGKVGMTGWTRVPALYYEVRWPRLGGHTPIDPALLCLALPLDDLDARVADPRAGLPADFADLSHLGVR
ncbi:MAG: M23 family metallopeptidase [Acidobacteria bacterium]|nr:M23 family metallopeptidase [Acidobacteriota bacterium]